MRILRRWMVAGLPGLLPGLLGVAPGASVEPLDPPGAPEWRWERMRVPDTTGPVQEVAISPDGGWWALGDARGVVLGRRGEPGERVLRRGAVHALHLERDGALWAATDRGLFRRRADGAVEDRSPGPGAARVVRRLDVEAGWVLAAGPAGAFLTMDAVDAVDAVTGTDGTDGADGRAWRRVGSGLPSGAIDAVLLRSLDHEAVECWFGRGGEIWRGTARAGVAGPELASVRRQGSAGPSARSPVRDLRAVAGVIVALGERTLSVHEQQSWRGLQLALPPGARARRVSQVDGRWWLATDRGLHVSARLEGPWRRAEEPVGALAVNALADGGDRLWLASERGVWVGSRTARARAEDRLPGDPRPGEPDVQLVQHAALSYLGLGPARLDSLRRNVDRRGYWPRVDLRFTRDQETLHRHEFDQAFISSGLRELNDEDRSRASDLSASLTFSWDLGDAVFHPDALDVSRERREVVELRDDILDEVTQLYFERRRVLLSLSALDPGASELESRRLRLRADELAAGLDAWTGGWFSRHAPPLTP